MTDRSLIEQIAANEWGKASPYDTVGVVRARIRKAIEAATKEST